MITKLSEYLSRVQGVRHYRYNPGATYHIMQRGIRRQDIFKNDDDYHVFMSMLKGALEKFQCRLHAFCLMTNHYHLLLETDAIEIWTFMKWLAQNYALYYNSINGYSGHLFENRYKSVLVKDDTYFLQVSRYIHLNPVKAKMVLKAEDYPWSGYRTIVW